MPNLSKPSDTVQFTSLSEKPLHSRGARNQMPDHDLVERISTPEEREELTTE